MPYLSAVTLSATAGWAQPRRFGTGSQQRGKIQAISVKASTSSMSQIRIQIGYGYRVSAASAQLTHPVTEFDSPPVAGVWNISSTGTSGTVFQDVRTWTDAPVPFDFNLNTGAPGIYSGETLLISGGLWARAIAVVGSGTPTFDLRIDKV